MCAYKMLSLRLVCGEGDSIGVAGQIATRVVVGTRRWMGVSGKGGDFGREYFGRGPMTVWRGKNGGMKETMGVDGRYLGEEMYRSSTSTLW